jgi:hypothetical protein
VYLRLGQADPDVDDVQRTVRTDVGRLDRHAARGCGIHQPPGGRRVDGVLQQLPQVDPRARIEVLAEELDDSPEIDLEAVLHHPVPRLERYATYRLARGPCAGKTVPEEPVGHGRRWLFVAMAGRWTK